MWSGAFEIEAVTRFEFVVALIVKPDFEFTAKNVEEFFAVVRIGLAAAAARFDAEKMRFHGSVAPGEQFHADAAAAFEDLSFGWTNERRCIAVRVEQRHEVRFVESRDALQCGDRRAHLAALQCAQKTDRDASGARHLCEREAAFQAETAKALARRLPGICRRERKSLFLQNVNDRGGIQAPSSAKEDCALEETNVRFAIQAIAAFRALRRD